MNNAESYRTYTDTTGKKVNKTRAKYIFKSKQATPRQVIHTSIGEHNNRPKQLEILHYSVF